MSSSKVLRLDRTEALGGLDIHHWRHVDFGFSPHCHDEWVLAAYRAGRKAYRCHHDEGLLSADDFLVIAPGTVHSAHTADPEGWSYVSISPTLEQVEAATGLSTRELMCRVGSHCLLDAENGGRELSRQLLEIASQPFDAAAELMLSELMLTAMGEQACGGCPRSIPGNLARVRQWIRDEPERAFTLKELSAVAAISPEHLSRSFKARFGLTPFQMLSVARTDRARTLIRQGSSLSEAAVGAGFADQSHMNRWFGRVYGASPGRFRGTHSQHQ